MVPGAVDRGCCPHYQENDTVVPGKMGEVTAQPPLGGGQPSRTEYTAEEGGCFSLLPSSMPTGPGSHVHVHGRPPGVEVVPALSPLPSLP